MSVAIVNGAEPICRACESVLHRAGINVS
jgi:hypothetical protein